MRTSLLAILVVFSGLLLSGCSKKNPIVEIQTPKGKILVEIYIDQAPITAENFLKLVKEGVYDGGAFYRTVRSENDTNPISISVVQGGIMRTENKKRVEAIAHETTDMTAVKHLDGTISMARSKPGTASSEFFICMGDHSGAGDRHNI